MTYPILNTVPNNPLPFTWVIQYPEGGGIAGGRLSKNVTALRIDAYVVGATSATFNIEERTAIGIPGTNLVTDDLVATVTGVSTTTFTNADLATGNWLWVDVSAVSGTPTQLIITLTY